MKLSRRDIAKAGVIALSGSVAGGGLPVAAQAKSTASPVARPDSFVPWVDVSRATLRRNVANLSAGAGGVPLCVVVKHRGYGMGEVNVAQSLEDMPQVWGFMTTRPEEAMNMVRAGIRKPIFVQSPVDEESAVVLTQAGVHLALSAKDTPAAMRRVADRAKRPVKVHLDIDGGLNRQGIPIHTALDQIAAVHASGAIAIQGMAGYFVTGPVDDWAKGPWPPEIAQIAAFEKLFADLRAKGIHGGLRHMVTSISYFQYPQAYFDMIRPGAAVYGGYPDESWRANSPVRLDPVYNLRARIAQISMVKAGDGIGYAGEVKYDHDVWTATLLAGYHDGYRVDPGKNKSYPVLVNGVIAQAVFLTGTHTVIVLGREQIAKVGDIVTLLGSDHPDIRPEPHLGGYASYYFSPELHRVVVE